MEGFSWLLMLCASMFVGAYAAGLVPLTCAMNASRLRFITIFGAGLLVGTALIVIIPEGVAMHYQARAGAAAHAHDHSGGGLAIPPGVRTTAIGGGELEDEEDAAGGHAHEHDHDHGSRRRLLASAAAGPADETLLPHKAASIIDGAKDGSASRATLDDAAKLQRRKLLEKLGRVAAAEAVGRGRRLRRKRSSSHSQDAALAARAVNADENDADGGSARGASSQAEEDASAGTDRPATAAAHLDPGDAHAAAVGGEAASGGEDGHAPDGAEESGHSHGGHWQIGAALALGFAFQLIVDRLSGGLHSHGSAVAVPGGGSAVSGGGSSAVTPRPASAHGHSHGGGGDKAGAGNGECADGGGGDGHPRENPGGDHSAKSKSAMAGLVVHAMVDGVALGAAVREGDGALGMLVFVAIMLHKAPSAFGLASYLLHHGISKQGVQRRLLLFSSAAPAGAIATYGLLSANLFSYKLESVALCLLFSGGTFLYVATAHVLPEIQEGDYGHAQDDDDEGGRGGHKHHPRMPWREVWTLIAGVLLPLLLNLEHGH